MENSNAYLVLVFYAVLAIVAAAIGQKIKPGEGFTNGYLVGLILSIVLWYGYGKSKFGPGSTGSIVY